MPIKAHVSVTQTLERYKDKILQDLMLEDMWYDGSMDEVYTAIIIALRENKTKADILSESENFCREYHSL